MTLAGDDPTLTVIGVVESSLTDRHAAPKQGDEGAPDAWLVSSQHTSRPMQGVFTTRSPDRPNTIGLHPVEVLAIDDMRVLVQGLEAIDGTPIVDIKPVVGEAGARPTPPSRRDS